MSHAVIPSERGAAGAPEHLGVQRQLILSAYWLSLSFHDSALLGVVLPAQLLIFTRAAQQEGTLGLLGGFAALIGMLIQPVAGALSDLSSSRWGRRRPYLLGGAVVDIAGLLVVAQAPSLAVLGAGFLLLSFGNAISGAAYQAYIPDHVPADQRGVASGYMGAMTMVGTVGSFAAAGLLVAPKQAGPFYVAVAALIGAGAVLTALAIPDPAVSEGERPVVGSWRDLWIAPWHHPSFAWVFATRALLMLALYTLFTFVAYFVRDVVHVTAFVQGAAVVAGVATLAALGGGLLAGWLSDRVGRQVLVSGASLLMAAGLLTLAFVHQLAIVLGVGVVFGLALGTYMAVDWALAIDVLPDRGFAAKDLGLWGISTSLPKTVAPFVGGAVLVALAPRGPEISYGLLFLGASLCAALAGAFIWQVKT